MQGDPGEPDVLEPDPYPAAKLFKWALVAGGIPVTSSNLIQFAHLAG